MQLELPRYKTIDACRVCASPSIQSVLDLGRQELTGVFPNSADTPLTAGPLQLVWCSSCNLLQLAHSYRPGDMYGENYGYRSGLNQSMIDHLTRKVRYLQGLVNLQSGDTILDIGSNDCTAIRAYNIAGLNAIGIDPVGAKFRSFYPADVILVPEFFSASAYRSVSKADAKIITSIAMFYDLENPIQFAQDIEKILAPDGVWHFEQSYMPSMLRLCSYDTICHEHIEFYSLSVVRHILSMAGLRIVDVQMNAVNGGSFAVTCAKVDSKIPSNDAVIGWLLEQEQRMGLTTPRPYREFEERVFRHRDDLRRLLQALAADGKRVLGYGASTKGNVVLQFCGLSTKEVTAIADVNPDKFGKVTPRTHIPIISEASARAMEPDYFLVLPWHFKEGILRREQEFLDRGGRMIFPFPEIEIV